MKVIIAIASAIAAFSAAQGVETNSFGYCTEVSISSIKPAGEMRKWCAGQAEWLAKSRKELGYPFTVNLWAGEEDAIPPGQANALRGKWRKNCWRQWADTACFADGLTRLGVMLDDREILSDVALGIHYTVSDPQQDGFLGPNLNHSENPLAHGPSRKNETRNLWPAAAYSRALFAYYAHTHDPEILHAIEEHCEVAARDSLSGRDLWVVEAMCSLYLATGNAKWRDMATRCWDKRARHKGKRRVLREAPGEIPAMLYLVSGREKDRREAVGYFERTFCGEGAAAARDACAVADGIWSLGYVLMATGDAKWGDVIERLYWNEARARAVPESNTNACCKGNFYRLTPAYVSRAWMKRSSDGAPVAALYCDSVFAFESGDVVMRFEERTAAYPRNGRVFIRVQTPLSARQPFVFRVPSWTRYPEVLVNGEVQKIDLKPGTFAEIDREWENGDVIVLDFPNESQLEAAPPFLL